MQPRFVASPVTIPVRIHDEDLALSGAVFWLQGRTTPPTGRPVVVFNHGSPMTLAERQAMTPFGSMNAIR